MQPIQHRLRGRFAADQSLQSSSTACGKKHELPQLSLSPRSALLRAHFRSVASEEARAGSVQECVYLEIQTVQLMLQESSKAAGVILALRQRIESLQGGFWTVEATNQGTDLGSEI